MFLPVGEVPVCGIHLRLMERLYPGASARERVHMSENVGAANVQKSPQSDENMAEE